MNTSEVVMHLNSPWFELVRSGRKIYEGRRKTQKTTNLQIGQIIEMRHYTDKEREPYKVRIDDILYYPTFEEALRELPIEHVLPLDDITIEKGVEIYQKYVSLETQKKDGVILLKIVVI